MRGCGTIGPRNRRPLKSLIRSGDDKEWRAKLYGRHPVLFNGFSALYLYLFILEGVAAGLPGRRNILGIEHPIGSFAIRELKSLTSRYAHLHFNLYLAVQTRTCVSSRGTCIQSLS